MLQEPHYVEHRKRLKERFRERAEGLRDYELLELLLTYSIPRKDVKPVAKGLIKRFGSLSGVLDGEQSELETSNGLGPHSATLIRLCRELCCAYLAEGLKRKDALSSPEAVVDFARARLAGLAHEAFMVIFLNVKNEVLRFEILHEGTVDRAVIYPRRIVEAAIANRAVNLILVHNHPSGHTEPSAEDKVITRSIVDAARTLEIRVLDHLIVGRGGHFSFAANGLIGS
jgi:DNA repair protein RadC